MGANNEKKFKILKKLGEGGFGEVYLIEKDKEYYALKKTKHALKEEEIIQYNKIINILKNINNIFVTKYYYTFTEKNSFNIVMEFCGEKNLKQLIAEYRNKEQLIEEKKISFIIAQICFGLREIHKNNLIHRDLTPDNIFIDKNNIIKIGDFGISKIITTNKYTQKVIGKYQYFAPEIELGEKYNNKIDIYSFGCIIYELFTLNEYYIDKKIREKVCQIDSEVYNPEWQNLINLLLNKHYHQRPDIEAVFRFIADKNLLFNYKELININIKMIDQNRILMQLMEIEQMQMQYTQALQKEKFINIRFLKNWQSPVMIQCRTKDKISDIISKYRLKSLDENEKEKFIFNAKVLNQHLTVEEVMLHNGNGIFVVETK